MVGSPGPTGRHLPPYAPGRNPVEGIWSPLRRDRLSDAAFSTPNAPSRPSGAVSATSSTAATSQTAALPGRD
ncbi:hypothetical protein GCM10010421_41000 [Streptomyces glaucus]|uniref:Transposase n=1 Tax=Streptomyces glaucus TaxID=284029 RepID=A0ABN3JZV7_9ACTN